MAVDSNGDVYIADTENQVIEEVVPSATPGQPGTLSVVAGKLGSCCGLPTPVPATSTTLYDPSDVAVGGSGDLFISDTGDESIVEVVPNMTAGQPGTLSVIAGVPGTAGAPTQGDAATGSDLNDPQGLAVEGGYVYVADSQSDVILKFLVGGGPVVIVAGKAGQAAAPTNDSAATDTELNYPTGVAVDASGNVFIADNSNYFVEEVLASNSTLYEIAGNGDLLPPSPGDAQSTPIGEPDGVAVDSTNDDVYIADAGERLVAEVQPAALNSPSSPGTLSVVAGFPVTGLPIAGPATHSPLNEPASVAVDSHGNLYIADQDNDDVEEVTPAGQLSVVAGDGQYDTPAAGPTPAPATSTGLADPTGVAVDSHGDIFITDDYAHEVLEVVPSATAGHPGTLSVIAGDGSYGAPVHGPATASPLEAPSEIAVNGSGDVVFSDSNSNTVDEVVPNTTPGDPGTLSVIAGVANKSGLPIPGPADLSKLDQPQGVAIANDGDVYIADTSNDTIDEVVPSATPGDPGTLSVIVGRPGDEGFPAPGPAFASELSQPTGVAVSANGTLYIADAGDDTIEEVTPATTANPIANVTTIAGDLQEGPPRPGLAIDSPLYAPAGVEFDSSGNIYIADSDNDDIEEVFAK